MSYRPQFAYPAAPPGWADVEFAYVFDMSSLPALSTPLYPGQEISAIPLALQRDAEFRWRAVQVANPSSSLGLRFRCFDDAALSEDYAPVENFSSLVNAVGGLPGGAPVALEDEIVCPAGAVLLLDLKNLA